MEKEKMMIDVAEKTNQYQQLHGDITSLKSMETAHFDLIICHLVLEFVENPKEILQELLRVLKPNGKISIIRHNVLGRNIQAIVQDYDLKEAKSLISGGYSYSSAFGNIKYYQNKDVLQWSEGKLNLCSCDGIRTLASLHRSDVMSHKNWLEDMLSMELELLKQDVFKEIAYFNHLILEKTEV